MSHQAASRFAGIAGLLSLIAGLFGAYFEAGFPDTRDVGVITRFVLEHKSMLISQSLAFSLSPILLLFMIAGLAERLKKSGASALWANSSFGAAAIWIGLQVAAQCIQIGYAMATTPEVPASLALMSASAAMLTLSGIGGAAFLFAVGIAILADRQLPVWFAALSLVAALAQLLIWMTAAVESGPFSPVGWTAYILQPFLLVWLLPAALLLLIGRRANSDEGKVP